MTAILLHGLGSPAAAEESERLTFSGEHRTHFEVLDGQYRAGRSGNDQVLLLRTRVKAELGRGHMDLVAEVMDCRSSLADSGTPLSTGMVNPLDILQAYVSFRGHDVFIPGGESELRVGRVTIDVGSRRFVARNRYRNAINAFTGVDWRWSHGDRGTLRAFYTMPVQRRVDGTPFDDKAKLDREMDQVRFWGVHYVPRLTPRRTTAGVFLLGLDEEDAPGQATRDRDLWTAGFRVLRRPAAGAFDYQVEAAYQQGDSRASTRAAADLDHRAHFYRLEAGYSFIGRWAPRLVFQYDRATGDHDPLDGDNERFDTLFGARRFDFGPAGIYGPFARSNLRSPGVRVQLKPGENITSFVALRRYSLESSGDRWTTANIANGGGDSYIGSQVEFRLRWHPRPGTIRLETGAAYLVAGDLMDAAGKGDATFFYGQFLYRF